MLSPWGSVGGCRQNLEPGAGDVLLQVAASAWDVVIFMAVEGGLNAGGALSLDMYCRYWC